MRLRCSKWRGLENTDSSITEEVADLLADKLYAMTWRWKVLFTPRRSNDYLLECRVQEVHFAAANLITDGGPTFGSPVVKVMQYMV